MDDDISAQLAEAAIKVPPSDVDLCKFCREPGTETKPLLECLNCQEPYHTECSELQKVYQKHTKICSPECRAEVDKFSDKFCRMLKVPDNEIKKVLDKFLENKFSHLSDELFSKIDDVKRKFHMELEHKTYEVHKVQEQFRYKQKTTQDMEEKVEDLEAKLNVFEQEKLASHVAISGIPGGHTDQYYFEFFDNFMTFLNIPKNRIKCFRKYETVIDAAPQSQRNPDVFVLENEEQKNFLLEKLSKYGRINFGDIMNCSCKSGRQYRQRVTVREMITNYNASLLKLAERYINQGKLRDGYFEDGFVNVKTNRGDILAIKSFSELEDNVDPCKKDLELDNYDDNYRDNYCRRNSSGRRRLSFEDYQCYDDDDDSEV